MANFMAAEALVDFLRINLPVAPVPGVPEIRLHKAAPASGLKRLADADANFGSPYWAYHWAGGLALARHVLDHPDIAAGKRVLDLGSGGGLVAIAAAKAGATHVIAAETDPYGVAVLPLNAALNDVTIEVLRADPTEGPLLPVDVVLVGDLFYAPDVAARVTAFLDRCLAADQMALIGDPWRAHLPVARLQEISRYEVLETGNKPQISGVFVFMRPV